MDRYPNVADAALRLQETMIRHNGEPIIVKAPVTGQFMMSVYRLNDGAEYAIDPNSDELDISALQLGFMNLNNTALYISRRPERKQKQGFDYFHAIVYDPSGSAHAPRDVWNKDTFKAFRQTVLGTYPTFDDAIKTVKMSKAISRGMAIRRLEKNSSTLALNLCGTYDVGLIFDGGVLLSESHKNAEWLRKKLRDKGVEIAN